MLEIRRGCGEDATEMVQASSLVTNVGGIGLISNLLQRDTQLSSSSNCRRYHDFGEGSFFGSERRVRTIRYERWRTATAGITFVEVHLRKRRRFCILRNRARMLLFDADHPHQGSFCWNGRLVSEEPRAFFRPILYKIDPIHRPFETWTQERGWTKPIREVRRSDPFSPSIHNHGCEQGKETSTPRCCCRVPRSMPIRTWISLVPRSIPGIDVPSPSDSHPRTQTGSKEE